MKQQQQHPDGAANDANNGETRQGRRSRKLFSFFLSFFLLHQQFVSRLSADRSSTKHDASTFLPSFLPSSSSSDEGKEKITFVFCY